jgi:hypothetical protein
MKTLRGLEAVKVAEQHDVYLYDLQYKTEISAEQARAFIESKRDPNSFVLQNWPETDVEAEKIVMREFNKTLSDKRISEARIFDIFAGTENPLHLRAAEMAARRLADEGQLEIVEENKDFHVYRIPRTVGFHQEFLDKVRSVVCDDCAELDLDGPFHEACLMNFIHFLQTYSFSSNDIVEMHESRHSEGRLLDLIRPRIGRAWLAKTASVTKSKWKDIIRPVLGHEDDEVAATIDEPTMAWKQPADSLEPVYSGESFADTSGRGQEHPISQQPVSEFDIEKPRITKEDLIHYLQNVEIVDDLSELRRLNQEREALLGRIAELQRENDRIEKQRRFAEHQCQEMQRDMDVLIQAMQIAKRRGHESAQVVDATYETDA